MLYGLSIAPSELLDYSSVAVTRSTTATDGVLDYYLHKSGGAVTVSGGGYGVQEIQSLAISDTDQSYFHAMVHRLDGIIDLDFRQVENALSADVDFYYDSEIDLGDGDTTLGLATTTSAGGWELYLNYSALENDEPYRRYVLLHEFGHSLGLEHPFEDRDGDVFNGNNDPWSSAYPEDTVMAYRSPLNGIWPDFFSDNDIHALIEVWGAERQYLDDIGVQYNGNNFKDDIRGGKGIDFIYGFNGHDRIHGGPGEDELRGGLNADWVRGGRDNDRIFGGRGHDTLNGGYGNDIIRGGFGKDIFEISRGIDIIEDFRLSENDILLLPLGISYELVQNNEDLEILTQLGSTKLINVNQQEFENANRIIYES